MRVAEEKLWALVIQLWRVRHRFTSSSAGNPKMRIRHWWCSSRSITAQGDVATRRTRSSTFSRLRGIQCLYWKMESPQCGIYLMAIILFSPLLCHGGKNKRMRRRSEQTRWKIIKTSQNSRVSRCGSYPKEENQLMLNRDLLGPAWSPRRRKSINSNFGMVNLMSHLMNINVSRKLSKSRRFRRCDSKTTLKMLKLSSSTRSGESVTTSKNSFEAKARRIRLHQRPVKERLLMEMMTVTWKMGSNRARPSRAFQWRSFLS